MSIPILGKGKSGVADLRPPGQREPQTVEEWINHPSNRGLREFILMFRKSLRAQARDDKTPPASEIDILASYLAGFLTGMTLIQNVFLGSSAFIWAADVIEVLPDEDPPDPEPEVKPEENKEQNSNAGV